jgi:hypothetical protein
VDLYLRSKRTTLSTQESRRSAQRGTALAGYSPAPPLEYDGDSVSIRLSMPSQTHLKDWPEYCWPPWCIYMIAMDKLRSLTPPWHISLSSVTSTYFHNQYSTHHSFCNVPTWPQSHIFFVARCLTYLGFFGSSVNLPSMCLEKLVSLSYFLAVICDCCLGQKQGPHHISWLWLVRLFLSYVFQLLITRFDGHNPPVWLVQAHEIHPCRFLR